MEKIPAFCSWSGGKDSCLALYQALKHECDVRFLFSMLTEDGQHSCSHGLSRKLLERQAESLGISIRFASAAWDQYESAFLASLNQLSARGIKAGAFGDIDIEEHRQWVEKVCEKTGFEALLPLWKRGRGQLLEEFISLGFRALIVVVNDGLLDHSFLGRNLDPATIEQLRRAGIDASGERGEYHTFVYDGPLFKNQVKFETVNIMRRDGCSLLELA